MLGEARQTASGHPHPTRVPQGLEARAPEELSGSLYRRSPGLPIVRELCPHLAVGPGGQMELGARTTTSCRGPLRLLIEMGQGTAALHRPDQGVLASALALIALNSASVIVPLSRSLLAVSISPAGPP